MNKVSISLTFFFAGFVPFLFFTSCANAETVNSTSGLTDKPPVIEQSEVQNASLEGMNRRGFRIPFEKINEQTQITMQNAKRKKISQSLAKVIMRSYPKQSPTNVLALPLKSAVSKDDLKQMCCMASDETILVLAGDFDSPAGEIYIFSNQAFYIIAGKTYASYMKKPFLYNYFKGDPFVLVNPYEQLSTLSQKDISGKLITAKDGTKIVIANQTGIPSCIDAAINYLKSDSLKELEKQADAARYVDFIKGHTLIVPRLDQRITERLKDSIKKLAQTNADYVCLAVMAQMDGFNKPKIRWGSEYGFPDEMLLETIQIVRENNLKIVLKPMVNCGDNIWRAWIDFSDEQGRPDLTVWEQWWDEYEAFILHYIDIANKTNCEMFSIGCEMSSTEGFEQKWRSLIIECRRKYDGLLTYNVNHERSAYIQFWDALDVISISGYYHLGNYMRIVGIKSADQPDYNVTLSDLKAAWKPVRTKLKTLSDKWQKPVFFIECGVCSAHNVSRTPWEHSSDKLIYDGQAQADFYQAALETFWNEPWFVGFTWWDWPAVLYPPQDAEKHANFAIFGKPAEDVVKQWYSKKRSNIRLK